MDPMIAQESNTGLLRLHRLISASRPPRVPAYRVGERFRADRKTWPTTAEYTYGPWGHELTLFRPNISSNLVEEIRTSESEFSLFVEKSIFVLAFRFGTLDWGNTPYCWHLQPESRRVIPPFDPFRKDRSLLWVSLVGCEDGIVRAQRGIAFSPEFTTAIHDAIRSQAMRPFDPRECTLDVGAVYNNCSSIEQQLEHATVRAVGNS